MPKAQEIERKWYVIDATGKSLGRVAAAAASLLRGKHKPTFAPHADCGDHVIIINCGKAVLTGNKLVNKTFKWHTGWIGGLKEVSYKELMSKKPERAMMIAVNGMLPNNTVGRASLTRLRVYAGAEHNHEAQKPENYEI
jgi:large subunit ribosomal protein L13